jgi:hypothetical protein
LYVGIGEPTAEHSFGMALRESKMRMDIFKLWKNSSP